MGPVGRRCGTQVCTASGEGDSWTNIGDHGRGILLDAFLVENFPAAHPLLYLLIRLNAAIRLPGGSTTAPKDTTATPGGHHDAANARLSLGWAPWVPAGLQARLQDQGDVRSVRKPDHREPRFRSPPAALTRGRSDRPHMPRPQPAPQAGKAVGLVARERGGALAGPAPREPDADRLEHRLEHLALLALAAGQVQLGGPGRRSPDAPWCRRPRGSAPARGQPARRVGFSPRRRRAPAACLWARTTEPSMHQSVQAIRSSSARRACSWRRSCSQSPRAVQRRSRL
jgi:hypothetical protein